MSIGQNPRAVRVSPDGKTVYIYNALDFAVGGPRCRDHATVWTAIKVCEPPKTPEWVRGKILFNTALPPMTSRRWIACSSCHPDGHADGRVWHNPEGLRKTPALFGLAHTHPLHWSADRDEVQDFEYTIRGRLMQRPRPAGRPHQAEGRLQAVGAGGAPGRPLQGPRRPGDLHATRSSSRCRRTSRPRASCPPPAERGKQLFFSKEVGCANCHSGPYYTDSRLQKPFKLHDVGTGTRRSSEKMGPQYDTPTLLGVYRTAPYLHHGKAQTLRDVLTTCNKEDKHGKTSHLKPAEIDDLVEFLKSLPYETPPDETPNTVKYRFKKRGQDGLAP